MRLWSIHPKYLDAKGLVALWREGLLAQKVLWGKTKGYKNHPQLDRFKSSKNPLRMIAAYLHAVCDEANARGYSFDRKKILKPFTKVKLVVTDGQLAYEQTWLCEKLKKRDPKKLKEIFSVKKFQSHPIFRIKKGPIETWERTLNTNLDN